MRRVEGHVPCPICGSARRRSRTAEVAPFLVHRIWGGEAPAACLNTCERCGFSYFEPRLDDEQIAMLYRGYREAEYQRERQSLEPTYTPELNEALGGPRQVEMRRTRIAEALRPVVDLGAVHAVLDYGGDRGEFIPSELDGARRYVFEPSGVTPLDGICSLSDLSGPGTPVFDLVLCCHVLEHLTDPMSALRTIRGVMSGGGILFIEVPLDWVDPENRPPDQEGRATGIGGRIKESVLRIPGVAALYRRLRGQPPLPETPEPEPNVPALHEHVNFFTERPLRAALERAGFSVVGASVEMVDAEWAVLPVLTAVARKR